MDHESGSYTRNGEREYSLGRKKLSTAPVVKGRWMKKIGGEKFYLFNIR